MSVEFHVNGCAKITVFSGRSYLGYCSEAGVTVDTDPKWLPIFTDAYGDQTPEDIQDMGMVATISFELIKWDQTVLTALQTRMPGASGSMSGSCQTMAGDLGSSPNIDSAGSLMIGALLKQGGWAFPLCINRGGVGSETNPSCEGTVEGPFLFATCYVGPDSFALGTRNTRHRLTINALPNANGVLFSIGS